MRIWDICFWLSSGCKSIIDWLKGQFSDNRVFEAFWFFTLHFHISNILNFTVFFAILKIRDWKVLKALKHGSFSCKRKGSAATLGDNEFRTITSNSLGKFPFKTTEKAFFYIMTNHIMVSSQKDIPILSPSRTLLASLVVLQQDLVHTSKYFIFLATWESWDMQFVGVVGFLQHMCQSADRSWTWWWTCTT